MILNSKSEFVSLLLGTAIGAIAMWFFGQSNSTPSELPPSTVVAGSPSQTEVMRMTFDRLMDEYRAAEKSRNNLKIKQAVENCENNLGDLRNKDFRQILKISSVRNGHLQFEKTDGFEIAAVVEDLSESVWPFKDHRERSPVDEMASAGDLYLLTGKIHDSDWNTINLGSAKAKLISRR